MFSPKRHATTFLVMWCNLHKYYMTPTALSMAHDIDVSTSTSTGNEVIMPPNKYLNMTKAMVPLIAPSACARKHVIAKYMPKIYVSLKYHIKHMCQLVHMHMTTTSVYIPHMNPIKSMMWPGTQMYIHFKLFAYTPIQICLWHYTYICHINVHSSPKNN